MRGRIFLVLSMATLSGGCQSDADFDERYRAQSDRIEAQTANMQTELDSRLSAAAAAQPGLGDGQAEPFDDDNEADE